MYKFKNGQSVIIHSLGDGKEYDAVIVGCVVDYDPDKKGQGLYIVHMTRESWRTDSYPFPVTVMTDACIKAIDDEDLLDRGLDVWGGDIIVSRH